jgi:hypothetical protein
MMRVFDARTPAVSTGTAHLSQYFICPDFCGRAIHATICLALTQEGA